MLERKRAQNQAVEFGTVTKLLSVNYIVGLVAHIIYLDSYTYHLLDVNYA
jgi:hypothetical protein